LSKTYEIGKLKLDNLKVRVVQNGKNFNFNDIIKKFEPKDTIKDTTKGPTHFNLLNIEVNNATVYYVESAIPVNYFLKKINISSPGLRWDQDTIGINYALSSGPSTGDIKGYMNMNLKNNDYRLATIVSNFDLQVIEQYIKDFANYGNFAAKLDANIKASGNLKDAQNLNAMGDIAINKFHFGKDPTEDYVSFEKLELGIIQLNPKGLVYNFDSVILLKPFFKFEQYDYLNNVERMFGKKGAKVKNASNQNTVKAKTNIIFQLADYIQLLAKNFLKSNYKVNRLAIIDADFQYNDFSLREKFGIATYPLTITADSASKNKKWVNLYLKTGIKPYGDFNLKLTLNPKNNEDFYMTYKMENLPVAAFNPYLVTFTSFPLDRGKVEFYGNWAVNNGIIKSDNHLIVLDPRVSKRVRKKDTKWIPLPLIMAFVKERGNVIDYSIPITGDIKNPKFHLRDVIYDILKNILIKPPTTPYRLEVKNVESKIENLLTLKWDFRQSILTNSQENFMEEISDFLKENEGTSISVMPISFSEKEKEHIAYYEAKKKYFLQTNNKKAADFCEDDSIYVDKLSVKNEDFLKFLNRHIKDSSLFTVQEKCTSYVGQGNLNKRYAELLESRKDIFMQYFKDNGSDKQVKIGANKSEVPFNGFSYYKITYKGGEIPKSLKKAYSDLNDLNDESPRKKYLKKRNRFKIF
ncbi:MAG: DUF748 domain-containing protein, partial [Bacteroidia bacterium]|nr:DUF748 domain-containing protein [Bacteroidia bacterium]